MKTNLKTTLAILLFIPLAALLLSTFACLPVPIGDPEKSKVDDTLSGIYQLQAADPADKDVALAILRPWDARTYLLQYFTIEAKDDGTQKQVQHFKCWLTTIAGKTFLTAQPMDDLDFALGKQDDKKTVYPVLRVDKVPSGLEIRLINPDSDFLKGLTKPEEFEAAIKAHAEEKDLYGEPTTFKKLAKNDRAFIEETMEKFSQSEEPGGKIVLPDMP